MKKIVGIISIIMFIIMFFNTTCYSFRSNNFNIIDTNSIDIDMSQGDQFDDFGSTIVSTIRVIGMIMSIVALMIIGIRYMLLSVEEKALEKEQFIYYCIGAVLVFSIVNIISVIYNWIETL